MPLDHYRTVYFNILDEAGEDIRNRITGKGPEILALAEEIVVSGIQGKLQESSTKLDTPRHHFCDDINVTTLHKELYICFFCKTYAKLETSNIWRWI